MLRAGTGSVVVLVVPGVLVAVLLRLRLSALATWAVVPALSLGTVFFVAQWFAVAGIPFDRVPIGAVLLVLAALAWLRTTRLPARARTASADERWVDDDGSPAEGIAPWPAQRVALGLLIVAIVVGGAVWARGLHGQAFVPPQVDGSNHGFFVARVLHTDSVDPADVVVSDASATFRAASFYPLAVHASAALVVDVFHAEIGAVLVAFDILFAAVVLPIGMFALARAFAPREPLIAGFTALAVPCLALFPFASVAFGDVPLVVGMALVPISVLVLASVLTDWARMTTRLKVEDAVTGALVLFAAVTVHTSQVPLIIVLVLLVTIERMVRRQERDWVPGVIRAGLVVGGVTALLLAPSIMQLAGGVSERSAISLSGRDGFGDALTKLVSLRPPQGGSGQALLALLALAGAVIWVLRRRYAWLVGGLLVLGVALLVSSSNNVVGRALGLPWYRSPVRLSFNEAFFVAFFAGVVLGSLANWLARRWARVSVGPLVGAAALTAIVFFAVIGYRGADEGRWLLRESFRHDALATRTSRAAYAWLDDHVRDDETVVNDGNADGSLWMYAIRGLRPLFAVQSIASDEAGVRDRNDRLYLSTHLGNLGRDPRLDQLIRRYNARWVYYDERVFGLFHHRMQLDAVRRNPRLRERFHAGTVYVFEIVDAR